MYAILSLAEVPEDRENLEREGLEFEEGAWVEFPPDIAQWPTGDGDLARRTLGRSTADPSHYKLFRVPEDAEQAGFEPTGMIAGGLYTPAMWTRLVTAFPHMKAWHAIPDTDPPELYEELLADLRRGR